MVQVWDRLLFLHWPVPPSLLRPLIPPRLAIDTYEGVAWIGVTPFTIPSLRPPGMPRIPVLGQTHEINVRTYVHLDGVPGVWFLSLDASNPLAVYAARLAYALPYFRAAIRFETTPDTGHFGIRRTHRGAAPASLEATWTLGAPLPESKPGSLQFFLTERYCLYAARGQRLYRARIHHRPWPLRSAHLEAFNSTMVESHGLPTPVCEPLLHAQAAPLHVDVWWPRRVG